MMKKLIMSASLMIALLLISAGSIVDGGFGIQAKAYTFNELYNDWTGFFEFEGNVFTVEGKAASAKDPWDGTADISWFDKTKSTFSLNTPEQLAGLAQLSNNGETFEGKTIYLTADIFMNDDEYENLWTAIADSDLEVQFEGTFKGGGHTVYNLYGDGLFGVIGEKGKVNAVNVSQGYICSGEGAVADENHGEISFCNNKSLILTYWKENVGGICGDNYNLIYGCKNYGDVGSKTGADVGGIAGRNLYNDNTVGTISECGNVGLVIGDFVGGIAGINYRWIYNCYNIGSYATNRFSYPIADNAQFADIINCYYADLPYDYKTKLSVGDCAIAGSEDSYENCYEIVDSKSQKALDNQTISKTQLLEKIDVQKKFVFSAWKSNSLGINNGFPITAADYNASKGKYKIIPEAWLGGFNKFTDVELADGSGTFSGGCYYNDSNPKVKIDNSDVAEVTCDMTEENTAIVTVKYKSVGNANIEFYFEETENCCEASFTVPLTITHTHTYDSGKITKAATCTADGVKTYTCMVCGDSYTEAIKAVGHSYSTKWTIDKAATCTSTGSKSHHCTVCGAKKDVTAIAKTAHTYKTTVVAPTYAAKGYTLHKCSSCGASYKDKYTPKKTVAIVKVKSAYTCTANSVKINWNKVSGAAGYKIYRYNPTAKKWTVLKTINNSNTLSYKDSGLKAATVYKYKVKAFAKSGGKTYFGSSSSTITTSTKPAAVKITKVKKTSTAARLYWKKVTCTGYRIQKYNPSAKKWTDVKKASAGSTNYKITGLKKNTNYKFRIVAYKYDGKKNIYGAWSYVTVKTAK